MLKTKEVATQLKVSDTAVRRACREFETRGYVFTRNAQGHRLFIPQDVAVIQRYLESGDLPGKSNWATPDFVNRKKELEEMITVPLALLKTLQSKINSLENRCKALESSQETLNKQLNMVNRVLLEESKIRKPQQDRKHHSWFNFSS